MIGYALRAVRGQLRDGRLLLLLAVGGVALGVASVLSIQILVASALGAFEGSARAVSGESTLTVTGRGPSLPDAVLPEVLAVAGVRAALPLVRAEVALSDRPGDRLEVVGADLLAPARLAWGELRGERGAGAGDGGTGQAVSGGGAAVGDGGTGQAAAGGAGAGAGVAAKPGVAARLEAALYRPGWVAVSPELAAERGWREGTRVAASVGSRRLTLEVGALVDFRRLAPLASTRLAVMDLAQAQALLGEPGRVQQIDVLSRPGVDPAALSSRLEARLGPGVRVLSPEGRLAEAGALLEAFRLNLTALSLVSLLVGGFLVYASTQAALVRRRQELGVLRCLGATRAAVVGLVLSDAVLLGLLGSAAGIPLGWAAARANLAAVSGTLQSLYLLQGVERAALSPGLAALGLGLGVTGAVLGALVPAIDVAREDPRDLLSARRAPPSGSHLALRLAGAAVLLLSAAAALAFGPWRASPWAGFAVALLLLVAVPLLAPVVLRAVARLPAPGRLGVAYGARDLAYHLRSTAVAAGALAVAVAMLCGITVMVGSFRRTVEDWLSATLRADVYVTTPGWRRGRVGAALAPEVVARLSRLPGVRAVDRLRQLEGEVGGRRVPVSGFDAGLPEAEGRVELAKGDRVVALRAVRAGAALVSEPLARRQHLAPGKTLTVQGPEGTLHFPVAGVYRDYGAEGGAVLLDLAVLEARFGPGPVTNVALYLQPGRDADAFAREVGTAFAGEALVVRSNRRLRAEVLRIFEQTFAVTRLLQVMSLVVAVTGVTLSLLVLARERSAEVALLRSLGAVRGQVARLFVGRALGIALCGLGLGALGGAGLALALVELVNPAWFGWSLGLHPPWGALARQAAVLLGAALLASAYPALRASRTPAAELARDAL